MYLFLWNQLYIGPVRYCHNYFYIPCGPASHVEILHEDSTIPELKRAYKTCVPSVSCEFIFATLIMSNIYFKLSKDFFLWIL